MNLSSEKVYLDLLEQISGTYIEGRARAVQAVHAQLIETYWQVGRHIVEFEQAGKVRADYGKALILCYPISQKPSHQLSWSHYVELLKLDDELERGFYENKPLPSVGRCRNSSAKRRLHSFCAWRPARTRPTSCNSPPRARSSADLLREAAQ